MPVMRRTAAIKITGVAALDEANFLKPLSREESFWTGALLVVLLDVFEREEDFVGLFFEPLEELLERDLPDLEVLALISRYLLFP